MTNKEAIERITVAREGYLKLIEENVSEGQLVGDGITGVWRSDTPLNDVYQQMADAMGMAIKALEQPEIIRCRECKYSHMTYGGECKYCDILFPDEKCYMDGDYFCASAERREEGGAG